MVQLQNAVAGLGKLAIMSDKDRSKLVGLVKFFDESGDAVAGFFVEVARGFVGEEVVGASDQCAGQNNALLLAAGEFAGAVVGARSQSNFIQPR